MNADLTKNLNFPKIGGTIHFVLLKEILHIAFKGFKDKYPEAAEVVGCKLLIYKRKEFKAFCKGFGDQHRLFDWHFDFIIQTDGRHNPVYH